MRNIRFKPPLKQSIRASVLAQELMAGRKLPEARADVKARYGVDIDRVHTKSAAAQASDTVRPGPSAAAQPAHAADLEGPVKTAISELLSKHPRVLFAVRQNSGAAWSQVREKAVPVYFYKLLTGQPVTITDFWGFLKDGRAFAIDAKKPSFTEARTEREFKQAAFMQLIRNIGGVGGFARSAEEANDILS